MIGPSYPFKGGIAQYTTALYRELAREHDVLFLSFKRQYPDWLYPGRGDRDFSDTGLREAGSRRIIDSLNPLTWFATVREIAAFQPDLVIFPWWVMFWAPQFIVMARGIRRRLPGARLLFVCHNVMAHEPGPLSKLLTRLTLRTGDAFLVQSEQDQRDLETMLDRPAVTRVEHPGYHVADQPAGSRDEARRALGLDPGEDVLLFFGFVRPYKGVDVLLEAMQLVVRRRSCRLVVAGEIWEGRGRYLEQVERLGLGERVRLVDAYVPQQEVDDYFLACDLVVLPYLSATGSGVVKLAYSYGRPVVVSAVGSLPDAVVEGQTGYVVAPGRPDDLAAAIASHLADADRGAMEAAIRDHVRQFSWEPVLRALEALGVAPRQ